MEFFTADNREFETFINDVDIIISDVSGHAKTEDIDGLNKLIKNFKIKTGDFYRDNRKLNIGVVGQVKAGKSSFLNTLLFGGQEILPKASTPKTATLTKMEYSEENIIQIDYYSLEDWEVLADNARVDLDDEIYTSAREIVDMVRRNGLDVEPYLKKGSEGIRFDSYDDLIQNLNDYVGEDGKYTPIIKAVTLYLNKEDFRGISIVDTPGLNDPIASRTIRTKEFMELCDVVFFLSQSGSFLDKSDWVLLSSQLPQKGVKRLVLIASKYDSGIRDILRVQDEDDDFDEGENVADNIPKACKIIKKKLSKRAKSKVDEFVRDLEERGSSPELIEVIKQCADPLMVSSLAYNMTGKPELEFTSEERNIYSALKLFSNDMDSDLKLLGNFDEVKGLFDEVVTEKEHILEQKAKSFVPNAKEELKNLLLGYKDKTEKRVQVLETNDREQLINQKKQIESQMSDIKADIATVFGEINAKLESEKAEGVRELREASKDYLDIRERSGSKTVTTSYEVSDSKWYKPLSWGTSHIEYESHVEHYSYCIAADAVENLRKFSLEATNKIEEVFTDAIQIKEIKRKLLNVVVDNFDMGSEKYDSSLFRIMVEETVSAIEFPIFNIDISDAMDGIAGRFSGEVTSASQKNELSTALSNAVSKIYDELCNGLIGSVKNFKDELMNIGHKVQDSLLSNIESEFELLLEQCENKDKEVAEYREYLSILEKELGTIK
ncbi:dynamin family protein [Filifactor alocis]|uniref:dynamin family protein n=1 Tax=Filifactor alocis TaxID=143361 RepID=UPI0028D86BA2|nr:dynamin family protein [Filifactor alocis]